MWIFSEVVELGVLVVVVGTALGLSLRAYDEWLEKRKAAQIAAALGEDTTKTETFAPSNRTRLVGDQSDDKSTRLVS